MSGMGLQWIRDSIKHRHELQEHYLECPFCKTTVYQIQDPVDGQVFAEGRARYVIAAGYRMAYRAKAMGLLAHCQFLKGDGWKRAPARHWSTTAANEGPRSDRTLIRRCSHCHSIVAELQRPLSRKIMFRGGGSSIAEAMSDMQRFSDAFEDNKEITKLRAAKAARLTPPAESNKRLRKFRKRAATMSSNFAQGRYVFTSESVSEGHPDKVCDFVADSILDFYLSRDPLARVAVEVLAKAGDLVVAGEVTSRNRFTNQAIDGVVRNALRSIGYIEPAEAFSADNVRITRFMTEQSTEIGDAVSNRAVQGAGDQGIMFGYATEETPEMMPLPILLAHRVAFELAQARRNAEVLWLRPDAKTQVSVLYDCGRPVEVTDVLVSTQHTSAADQAGIRDFITRIILPRSLREWWHGDLQVLVNPSGSFLVGGPEADAGVTGRKIIVDTYGGFARHGGGAFSGKDPSKVDRSGAYFCRFVARQIVRAGLAKRAEVQVSYAIGRAKPVSVMVETFGTGDPQRAEKFVHEYFDFRPAAIIERLDLLRPIYRQTTNYGHFGRGGLPWES